MATAEELAMLVKARDEASSVIKGVGDTVSETSGKMTEMAGSSTKAQAGAVALGGAALMAAQEIMNLGREIANTVVESLKFADEIQDTANMLSLTTDEVQKFSMMAEMEGMSLNNITQMAGYMSRAMETAEKSQASAAAKGVESTDAFTKLGVSLSSLQTMNVAQQMDVLFGAISKIPNANERMAITSQLFGRAGQNMLPIIQNWSANQARLNQMLEDFGLKPEQVETMAAAEQEMNAFNIAMKYMGMSLSADLAPAMKILLPALVDLTKQFSELLKSNPELIQGFAQILDMVLKLVQAVIWLVTEINKIPILGSVLKSSFPPTMMAGQASLMKEIRGYASGGIVNSPQLAMVGESGPEAIIPLSQMSNMGGGTHLTIQMGNYMGDELSLRRFTREVQRILNEEDRRRISRSTETSFYSVGGHL